MPGILEGLRVVEGSAFIAAPLAGMTLGQLGAEVIRFDAIRGGLDYKRWPLTEDGESLYWCGLNKGKRSIRVDLRSPRGQELVTDLICAPGENAGIFLTNLPARGWLAYENLRKRREDLIMLAITGDRHGGTAVDYTVNSRVGFPHVTGPEAASEPTNHVLPGWDCTTAYMAALGLLAAERHRQRTGQGHLVQLALADMAYAMLGNLGNIAEVQINGSDRPRVGNDIYGTFGRDFASADGRRVMICGITRGQWSSIRAATGLGDALDRLGGKLGLDLSDEGNRFRAREEISAILEPWFGERSLAEISQKLDEHGACWGPYLSFKEAVETDPECSARNPMFSMVEQPGVGEYLMPDSPLSFAAAPRTGARPAPVLGEHTDAILAEVLGLDSGQIAKLHDEKVVAGPV